MRLQAEVYLFDIYIALSRLELQIYSCLAKTLFFITSEGLNGVCGKLFVYVHVLSGGLFRVGLCNFADINVN